MPKGLRIYAIGDVHGRSDLLRMMDAAVLEDLSGYPVRRAVCVYLGDLIDRGPDSRGVIEHLLAPPDDGLERRVLRGNHEDTALRALDDPDAFAKWQEWGGREAMHSYGIDLRGLMGDHAGDAERTTWRAALSPTHLGFLRGLETMLVVGDYCLVHAGIRPGVPLGEQDPQDLLWIRDPFLSWQGDFGKVVVHGHTPVRDAERHINRINVDTGAYLTGVLTAAVLEDGEVRFVTVSANHIGWQEIS